MWRFLDPAEILGDPLPTSYDSGLVMLSVLVASIAAYAALLIADRLVTADTRRDRWAWLATGSIAMGSGVWAMHFIGMLALSLPVSMSYSLPITLVSFGPAIFASAIALHVLSRSHITLGRLHGAGLVMAIGIGTMHYVGMEAMRMDAILRYNLRLFVVSFVVAHLLATSALHVKFFRSRWSGLVGPWTGVGSALLMGLAVAGMHYTAMAAGSFFPVAAPGPQVPSASWLPITVSLVGCGVTGLAIVRAIGDRQLQRLSTSLISSEDRFRTLLDAAGEGILALELDGTITFANPAMARMLDRPVEGLVGLRLCRRNASRASSQWVDLGPSGRTFATHLENLDGVSGSDHLRRADGTLIPIDYARTPLTTMGRVTGSVVTLSDATARTQAKAELMTARDEALEVARARSAFLATMSHEIRTPMNGVLRMSELLTDTTLTEEQQEFADSIRSYAEALLSAINDVSDVMDASSNEGPDADGELGTVRDDLLANRRVLLVEDNPVNQAVARAILGKLGCYVDLAENGVAAITAYGRAAYDLILMDGQMPEMDGYETTRRLRLLESGAATGAGLDAVRPAHVPIVAMTAHAMKGDRERCLEAGMDDYLSKPFTRSQLADVLHRCMADGPTEVPDKAADADGGASTPDGGVIDDTTLDELRALDRDGSGDSLRYVLTLYLDKCPQLMTRLAEAVEAGDAETMGQVAHSLKSASANVGATKLSTLCESFERIAELVQKLGYRPAIDSAGNTLAEVQEEYASVQAVLSNLLGDGAVSGSSQPIARAQ